MDNKDLITLAKSTYLPDGPNQWPHIQRVLAQAQEFAKKRQKPLTRPELAAILFHDVGKIPGNEVPNKDHGVVGGYIVAKMLENKLKKRELNDVLTAIADHNFDKPSKTAIGDLLRSSDANKLDVGWYLRKCYYKMKAKKGLG